MADLDYDIGRALERLAGSQPAAPAIHVPGRPTLTFGHLGAHVRYVRERLGGWGIARGDMVVGVVETRPEMAGEKISPIEIDGVIEAIPGVREAATFAMLLERLGLEGAPSSAEPSRSPPRASE